MEREAQLLRCRRVRPPRRDCRQASAQGPPRRDRRAFGLARVGNRGRPQRPIGEHHRQERAVPRELVQRVQWRRRRPRGDRRLPQSLNPWTLSSLDSLDVFHLHRRAFLIHEHSDRVEPDVLSHGARMCPVVEPRHRERALTLALTRSEPLQWVEPHLRLRPPLRPPHQPRLDLDEYECAPVISDQIDLATTRAIVACNQGETASLEVRNRDLLARTPQSTTMFFRPISLSQRATDARWRLAWPIQRSIDRHIHDATATSATRSAHM